MNLLAFLAGSLPPLILLYLQQRNHRMEKEQLMRILSTASLGIPAQSMEPNQEKTFVPKKPDKRQRMSIPLAVPKFVRDAYTAIRKERSA